MGKSGKFSIILGILLSGTVFIFGLKLVARNEKQKEQLQEVKQSLQKVSEERDKIEKEKNEKSEELKEEVEAKYKLELRLGKLNNDYRELENALVEEKRLREEETKAKVALQEKIDLLGGESRRVRELEERINQLEKEKETLEKFISEQGLVVGVVEQKEEKARKVEGTVLGIFPPFVDLNFGKEAAVGINPVLYAHRGNKVIGKVNIQNIDSTIIAVELNNEEFLKLLQRGDRVILKEGEQFNLLDYIEGSISSVSRQGLIAIDLDVETGSVFTPKFIIYREGEVIGEMGVKKLEFATIVASTGNKRVLKRIKEGDMMRMLR